MWANAERLLPFTSWQPAWHRLPPPPVGCATGQWVAWGWPACLTSVAAPRQCCCSPQRLCRWHRSCQSCHSPKQLPPLALSETGNKMNICHLALERQPYYNASLRSEETEIRRIDLQPPGWDWKWLGMKTWVQYLLFHDYFIIISSVTMAIISILNVHFYYMCCIILSFIRMNSVISHNRSYWLALIQIRMLEAQRSYITCLIAQGMYEFPEPEL